MTKIMSFETERLILKKMGHTLNEIMTKHAFKSGEQKIYIFLSGQQDSVKGFSSWEWFGFVVEWAEKQEWYSDFITHECLIKRENVTNWSEFRQFVPKYIADFLVSK